MKSYVLIIPYFGKLPAYFPVFLHSIRSLTGSIILITNDLHANKYELPDNFKVLPMEFKELQERVRNVFSGILPTGYKLCDYRPAYADLFPELVSGYEYWGYCDLDTLMGDVDGFLSKVEFTRYDRIGKKGHFTLYRNIPKINKLYLTKDKSGFCEFDHVKRTTFPCNFDERGMNHICKEEGIRFMEDFEHVGTEDCHSLHFHTFDNVQVGEVIPQLFTWEDGRVFLYEQRGTEITKKEFAYLHYQRRSIMAKEQLGDYVVATHEGFFNFSLSDVPLLMKKYGREDTAEERSNFEADSNLRMKKASIKKILLEFRICGLRAIINMWQRYRRYW